MDLYLQWIALGSVVGVTGAAVAAGAGRERNQQINLGEKFDEIAGANGTCFHEVLMRIPRIHNANPIGALSDRAPRGKRLLAARRSSRKVRPTSNTAAAIKKTR